MLPFSVPQISTTLQYVMTSFDKRVKEFADPLSLDSPLSRLSPKPRVSLQERDNTVWMRKGTLLGFVATEQGHRAVDRDDGSQDMEQESEELCSEMANINQTHIHTKLLDNNGVSDNER